MVSVLVTSEVDRTFEPQSGQIKDYKIGICCFYAKHATLRRRQVGTPINVQSSITGNK
jgi:hypothetical protein